MHKTLDFYYLNPYNCSNLNAQFVLKISRNRKDGDLVSNYRIKVDDHIYLGGYHEGDADKLVEYLNDITIYNNTLNIPHPYTIEDANWWFDHISKEGRKLGLQPNWSIRHAEFGLIGGLGMVIPEDTISEQLEIGYWLAKPYRRQGIMTRSIRSFSVHCFKKYKAIKSMSAHIFVQNDASQSTIKKAGFTMTRLIDDHYKKGEKTISAYEYILNRTSRI